MFATWPASRPTAYLMSGRSFANHSSFPMAVLSSCFFSSSTGAVSPSARSVGEVGVVTSLLVPGVSPKMPAKSFTQVSSLTIA